jgi:hypothetical protein
LVDACMYMDQLATLYIRWVISHRNLAESLPLKQNHSWEGLSHIWWKKKHVWNHQPAVEYWDRSENGGFTSGILLKGSILHDNHVAAAVAHDNHSYHCYHQYYYIISKYHLLVLCLQQLIIHC